MEDDTETEKSAMSAQVTELSHDGVRLQTRSACLDLFLFQSKKRTFSSRYTFGFVSTQEWPPAATRADASLVHLRAGSPSEGNEVEMKVSQLPVGTGEDGGIQQSGGGGSFCFAALYFCFLSTY